jgi:photosystem II stability/assembly factor-like uncharacterized protein
MKRKVFLAVALFALMAAVLPAQTSAPGVAWKKVENNPFGTTAVYDIAFANNTFVAVGASGKIAYSDSGKTFTAVANSQFGTTAIRAVAFGGGRFVAVGDAGKAAYSTNNGRTWTASAATGFGTSNIQSVAYGANRFVAVGKNGKIAYSTNGQTWTMVPAASQPSKNDIPAIAFGNNKFIITDTDNVWYSGNGETWTSIAGAANKSSVDGALSISFVNNMFFAPGYFPIPDKGLDALDVPYSRDGVTWTHVPNTEYIRSFLLTSQYLDIAYGAGKYILAGINILFYSTDLVTWTYMGFDVGGVEGHGTIRCIAFGANRFVVAGTSGTLMYSE